MKTLLKSILIGLLIGNTALAGLPPTTIQGQSDTSPKTKFAFQVPNSQATDLGGIKTLIETGNTNALVNASFEAATPATGWTAGSNVSSAVNTTSYVDGKQSLTLSASATFGSAQVIWYQDWTPGSSLSPNNGEASLYVNTTATTLQVCPRVQTVTLTGQCVSVPATGNWTKVSTNFIFPSSGSVGVALYSTAGFLSGATIASIDKGYVGLATNLAQVSQAQLIGGVVITGCSGSWTTSSGSFSSFPASTGCVYTTFGSAQAPSTQIPAVTFPSIGPGEYMLNYEGMLQNGGTSGASIAYYQFFDGTNSARETDSFYASANLSSWGTGFTQSISYTTPQSNITFQIRGKTLNSSATIFGTTQHPGVIKVYYFPSQSQTGYKPDQTPASWGGVFNSGSWSVNPSIGAWADFNGSTVTLVTRGTPRNITCSQLSGLPGITCNLPRQGNYKVCASGSASINIAAGAGTYYLGLTDGSNNFLNNAHSQAALGSGYQTPFGQLCGQYTASGAGSASFKLRAQINVSATLTLYGGSNPGLEWTVEEQDAPLAAPYLTGSVTSNTSGQERVERATIANPSGTGNASITSQSGSWISGTPGNGSAGSLSITMVGGIFSGTPTCTCSTTSAAAISCAANPTSTTSLAIFTYNTSGVLTDDTVHVICMGPR